MVTTPYTLLWGSSSISSINIYQIELVSLKILREMYPFLVRKYVIAHESTQYTPVLTLPGSALYLFQADLLASCYWNV